MLLRPGAFCESGLLGAHGPATRQGCTCHGLLARCRAGAPLPVIMTLRGPWMKGRVRSAEAWLVNGE